MLALVVAVALSQCTKDTDCKGERVCVAGECAEPSPVTPRWSYADDDHREIVDQLTRELGELRAELAHASPAGAAALIFGGLALGGLSVGFFYLFGQNGDDVYRYLGGSALVGGAILLIGGLIQLGLRLAARSRLPGEIADREERLRKLGAPDPKDDRVAEELHTATGCPRENIWAESTGVNLIRYQVCQQRYLCHTGSSDGVKCERAK